MATMVYIWQIAGHIGITLIALVGIMLRIEHRLTKIETDVAWLKNQGNPGKKGVKENDGSSKVDKA